LPFGHRGKVKSSGQYVKIVQTVRTVEREANCVEVLAITYLPLSW